MNLCVWIWGKAIGWWLHEEGYDNWEDATASLVEAIEHGPDDWTGGAIMPKGETPVKHNPMGK